MFHLIVESGYGKCSTHLTKGIMKRVKKISKLQFASRCFIEGETLDTRAFKNLEKFKKSSNAVISYRKTA